MRSTLIGFLGFILPLSSVAPALAEAILTEDGRFIYVSAQANSSLGGDQQTDFSSANGSTVLPFDLWGNSFNFNVTGAQSATAQASGSIISTVSPTLFSAQASVGGTASILDENAYDASFASSAIMEIGFSLDSPSTWHLMADLSASNFRGDGFGTASSTASLTQKTTSGNISLFLFSQETNPSIDHLVTLGPGDYILRIMSDVSFSNYAITQLSALASFDATFAFVPKVPTTPVSEPSSLFAFPVALMFFALTKRVSKFAGI